MKSTRVYLNHILDNIGHIERLATKGKQNFLDDPDTQAATLFYLHTLAESASKLPAELKATQPQISWSQIRGFRNIVVHVYLSIDLDRVWEIINRELSPLRSAIEAMLAHLGDE